MKRIPLALCALVPALAANAENYGNSTASVGADAVVTFTESGTFRLAEAGTVRVLLVGGGGAGGTRIGGGGGGTGGQIRNDVVLAEQQGVDGLGGGGAGGSNGNNSAGVDVSGGGKGGDGVVILRWSDPVGTVIVVK